ARKILKTHMADEGDEHKVDEIIENMASKLYFHGHPINRREAKTDLGLKVNLDLDAPLESAIWNLYRDFEDEFQNRSEFNPAIELANIHPPLPPLAQAPPAGQLTQLGQIHLPTNPVPNLPTYECDLLFSAIESSGLSSAYRSRRRYTRLPANQPDQTVIRE